MTQVFLNGQYGTSHCVILYHYLYKFTGFKNMAHICLFHQC